VTPTRDPSWQPRDCHAHTTWSDGDLSVEAVIAAVRARGVRPSISDHVTRDATHGLTSLDLVRAYLDALDALKHAVIVAHRDGRGYPLGLRRREKPPPSPPCAVRTAA